jgi:hypothetical protein
MTDHAREKDKSLIGRLPEVAKSMIVLSLGGVFMAEETLRKATRDLKLPRDAVDTVMTQAERGKRQLFDAIATEVAKALREIDLDKLAGGILRDFEMDIEAHIAFKPRRKRRKGAKRGTSARRSGHRLTTTSTRK